MEHVAVALSLARGNPAVATGTACKAAGVPKGRFWKQIGEWRERILTQNLLVECQPDDNVAGTAKATTDADAAGDDDAANIAAVAVDSITAAVDDTGVLGGGGGVWMCTTVGSLVGRTFTHRITAAF